MMSPLMSRARRLQWRANKRENSGKKQETITPDIVMTKRKNWNTGHDVAIDGALLFVSPLMSPCSHVARKKRKREDNGKRQETIIPGIVMTERTNEHWSKRQTSSS